MGGHTVDGGPLLTPIPFSWQNQVDSWRNQVDVEGIQHEARLHDSENRLIPAPTERPECSRPQAEKHRIKRLSLAGASDRIFASPVTEHVLDLRGHGSRAPLPSS